MIASALPKSHIVTTAAPKPDKPTVLAGSPQITNVIHIHTLPKALEVAYAYVNKEVPKILFQRATQDGDNQESNTTITNETTPAFTHQLPTQTPHRNYDIVLNIGLAPGRTYYTLETQAKRDGYIRADIYGKIPPNGSCNHVWRTTPGGLDISTGPVDAKGDIRGGREIKSSAPILTDFHETDRSISSLEPRHTPSILTSTYNMPDVFYRWRDIINQSSKPSSTSLSHSYTHPHSIRPSSSLSESIGAASATATTTTEKIQVQLSRDAGLYLCEYIYYTCLAEYWKYGLHPSSSITTTTTPPAPSVSDEKQNNDTIGGRDIETVDASEPAPNPGIDTQDKVDERKGLRPCFFLHVPSGESDADVAKGVRVVLALLEAVVGCER